MATLVSLASVAAPENAGLTESAVSLDRSEYGLLVNMFSPEAPHAQSIRENGLNVVLSARGKVDLFPQEIGVSEEGNTTFSMVLKPNKTARPSDMKEFDQLVYKLEVQDREDEGPLLKVNQVNAYSEENEYALDRDKVQQSLNHLTEVLDNLPLLSYIAPRRGAQEGERYGHVLLTDGVEDKIRLLNNCVKQVGGIAFGRNNPELIVTGVECQSGDEGWDMWMEFVGRDCMYFGVRGGNVFCPGTYGLGLQMEKVIQWINEQFRNVEKAQEHDQD